MNVSCLRWCLVGLCAVYAVGDGGCMSALDQAIWNEHGKTNFEDDLNKCGYRCAGRAPCVSKCVKSKESYSDGCSSCFGDLVGCSKNNCISKCILGHTPACAACVNQHCTPAFTTCSGFTPPSEFALEAFAGSCSDADEAIWNKQGKTNFEDDLNKCGYRCAGRAPCVSKCVKSKESYSDGCSSCFGDLVGCSKKNCISKCILGHTPACAACVNQHCTPAFTTCSGFTPPSEFTLDVSSQILV